MQNDLKRATFNPTYKGLFTHEVSDDDDDNKGIQQMLTFFDKGG